MEEIKLSELRPHSYINLDGEIITKEDAEALLAAGERPVLYTVSDEFIQGALHAAYEEFKAAGAASDVYTAPDPHAKRILY